MNSSIRRERMTMNMLEGSYQLGLSDLLDQNLSCYEYFHSLPKELQQEIERRDLRSFEEIQRYVASQGRGNEAR